MAFANGIHTGPIPQGRIGSPNGSWAYAQCFACRMVLGIGPGLLKSQVRGSVCFNSGEEALSVQTALSGIAIIAMLGWDESCYEPANRVPLAGKS